MTKQELLKYALDNDMIDLSQIKSQIDMSKRKERLKAHPFEIWQGKDGKWITYLPDKRKGRIQRVRNTREEIENIIVDYQAGLELSPLVKEIFKEWNDRRLKLEQISKATYCRNEFIFKRHFKVFGEKKIRNLDLYDWCDFLEEQIPEHKLSAKGFANLKSVVKGILVRAKRDGFIDYSPSDVYEELEDVESQFKKIHKKDCDEVYNEEETKILMDYFTANQDGFNLMLLLMFVTGMRVGEVAALKNEDIDNSSICVQRTETRYREGGKLHVEIKDTPKTEAGIRTIVVPPNYEWLLKRIKRINPFGEYVFYENGRRLTGDSARKRLYYVCKNLNIPHRSPHKIRKTYVSILLDNNMDGRFVMDQVGHASVEVSERFYHRNRKSVARKQELLDQIAEFG